MHGRSLFVAAFTFIVALPEVASANPLLKKVDGGTIRGYQSGGNLIFKGIPYAQPPVGTLRWKAPRPVKTWDGVKKTYYYGSICPQLSVSGLEGLLANSSVAQTPIGNEDCLYLNVWAPAKPLTNDPLPVMVYVHGGANVSGSASERMFHSDLYDGAQLAKRGPAIVVTFNYRLGALGFLAHPELSRQNGSEYSGNFAQLDQIAALSWVQRNIAEFGGDPSRVLLFGESAGALDSLTLYTSPLARGLFTRVLLQSMAFNERFLPRSGMEKQGVVFAKQLGCEGPDALECLYRKSMGELIQASEKWDFAPGIDGHVLTEAPLDSLDDGSQNRVPLIMGANQDELSYLWPAQMKRWGEKWPPETMDELKNHLLRFFPAKILPEILSEYPIQDYRTLADAEIAIAGDYAMLCPFTRITKAAFRSQAETVRQYFYTHVYSDNNLGPLRASHGFEIPLIFGNFPGFPSNWFISITSNDYKLSAALGDYWTRFASTGNPNGQGSVYWKEMSDERNYLVIDERIHMRAGEFEHCDFWDSLGTFEANNSLPLVVK